MKQRARDDDVHFRFRPDLSRIHRIPAEARGDEARADDQGFEPGERIRQGIRQAESEEVCLGGGPQYAERQHDQASGQLGLLPVGGSDRRDEAVAPPRERFDVLRGIGVVAQSLADLPDAEVQPLVEVHERVATPHLLANLLSRHDLAASPDQRLQDLERLRGKFDEVAVAAKLCGGQMELEGPKTKDSHRALIGHSLKTRRELSADQ